MILDTLINRDASFTVAGGVDQVAAVLVLGNQPFANADGDTLFAGGDNIKIKAMRLMLPYQFGQGDFTQINTLTILFNDLTTIPEFGDASAIAMPTVCDLLHLDLFIQAKAVNYGLVLGGITQNISMLNVPTSLVGQTLEMDIWMQVEHTLPMVP